MCRIEITANCKKPLPTVLSMDLTMLEMQIEDMVDHILLNFYEPVYVNEIRLHTSPFAKRYAIYVHARGDAVSPLIRQFGKQRMEVTLEEELSKRLTEFFDDVKVKRVTIID